jgi:uncharacterized protein (UPF0276 family)
MIENYPEYVSMQTASIASLGHGFGLGLRTPHYPDFLAAHQRVDWLEIITDNFLVEGGKPLQMLDNFRRDYPIAMHGVAMSLGAAGGLNLDYLRQVKSLADRIEPLWVSDHLCWTGTDTQPLHDLYPLPYTDAVARHVIAQIRHAQDVLQRRLVIENVSSYLSYGASTASEWQFLRYVAQEADCLLLVDVNNIFVSSVNHGFDPLHYLEALPAQRVQQIHLAGHSSQGDQTIDTHDHPVAPAVWALYRQACVLYGAVPAMVERDANIPPLAELIAELDQARTIAHSADASSHGVPLAEPLKAAPSLDLMAMQHNIAAYVLQRSDACAEHFPAPRLNIYRHAYTARLSEVLAESFAKTLLFMGSETFDPHAAQYALAHPPQTRSLNRYGAQFPEFLRGLYPHNPELFELAQLEWDLRTRFDGPDVPALTPEQAQHDGAHVWLTQANVLHPSVLLRSAHTNAAQLWKAIDADQEVPPAICFDAPRSLVVWRKDWRPHFYHPSPPAAIFLDALAQGATINASCDVLEKLGQAPHDHELSLWLRGWLDDGVLRDHGSK